MNLNCTECRYPSDDWHHQTPEECGGPRFECGSPADHHPYNPEAESESPVSTPDLNEAIRLFILNLPEVIALRAQATEPTEGLSEADVESIVESAVDSFKDTDLGYSIESHLENFDFSYIIENAINYGGVDLSGSIDADEVVENSSTVDTLKDEVTDLTSLVEALTDRLDTVECAIRDFGGNV